MEQIADDIESELYQSMTREIESTAIGEKVMEKLKKLDEVAYVRFASVYKSFDDIDTFMAELQGLIDDKKLRPTVRLLRRRLRIKHIKQDSVPSHLQTTIR